MARWRSGGVPAQNLIQNPDIVRRIGRMLGLRQRHVTPTLDEGLKGVVVVGDARDEQPPAGLVQFFTNATVAADPAFDYTLGLYNPRESGVVAFVEYLGFQAITGGEHAMDIGYTTTAAFDGLSPTIAFNRSISFGDRFEEKRSALRFLKYLGAGAHAPPQILIGNPIVRAQSFVAGLTSDTASPTHEPRRLVIPPGWVLQMTNSAPLIEGQGLILTGQFREFVI